MKKLWWLLAIFIAATAVKDGLDYFGPIAEAYRAYREVAIAEAGSKRDDPRFSGIEGNLVDIDYRLESGEKEGDGRVRLVVVESLRFQKLSESGPFGNRRVAQTRQNVLMTLVKGEWIVSELVEQAPEVRSLDDVELPGQ